MADLIIVPAIALGLIVGLVELFLVHTDEQAMGILWLTHGLHAVPFAILFVFINMNLTFALGLVGVHIQENFMIDLALRAAVGLVAMVKVASAAALVRGSMVGEKMIHSLLIGVLVAASAYVPTSVFTTICTQYHIPYC